MPKTGYKYTKQGPDKGSTHMLKRSNASSKVNRVAPHAGARDNATIRRLKMYVTGKAIRNKEGNIVGGQFMMKDRAGDRKIDEATGRIAPDRRWFGNTRVVNPTELDRFREEMNQAASDPYSVVLKRRRLPMGLLQDSAASKKDTNAGLLANEPFSSTFGSKSQRKRVKVEQLLTDRQTTLERDREVRRRAKEKSIEPSGARPVEGHGGDDGNGYAALLNAATKSRETYLETNEAEGVVPWGRDRGVTASSGEGVDWRRAKKDDLFLKGQSRRIWGEFFKVVDCSDVVLHVIDARDVPGTRCEFLEKHMTDHAKHKHLVFVLNKVDLVPNWVAKRWMGLLAANRPTIAFHASLTGAFGKGALLSLLRQFGRLHADRKMISVGVVGYPNVGKSSVINTLVSKKSCRVAPVPGETKVWQYVSLFKNVSLIDCPGVVVNAADDSEEDSVLKGVVRAERLESPEDFVPFVLARVRREHVVARYFATSTNKRKRRAGRGGTDGETTTTTTIGAVDKDVEWTTHTELLEKMALRAGRLLKGGEPCTRSVAITMIHDWQRGKLPHYVAPPELKEDEDDEKDEKEGTTTTKTTAEIDGVEMKQQNLDDVKAVEEGAKEDEEMEGAEDDKEEEETERENDADEEAANVEESKKEEKTTTTTKTATVAPPIVIGSGKWDDED